MFNFWQYFHDGTIARITGSISGDLEMVIEIEYLSKMFAVTGVNFIVSLQNCTRVECELYQRSVTSQISEIVTAELEILHADFTETGVKIECDKGILQIDYVGASITLDSGQPVTNEELYVASTRYWKVFGQDGQKNELN
jgi:hypothetical protein